MGGCKRPFGKVGSLEVLLRKTPKHQTIFKIELNTTLYALDALPTENTDIQGLLILQRSSSKHYFQALLTRISKQLPSTTFKHYFQALLSSTTSKQYGWCSALSPAIA